jgi:phospholipid N-methyltransferase
MKQFSKIKENYPQTALKRFDTANLWIKYIILQIKDYLKDNILEVGAGYGSFTKSYINNFKDILLLDSDKNNIKSLIKKFNENKNIKVLKSEVRDLKQNFNTIIYFNVLEHIEADILEIENSIQKLNIGGHLIILVPAHQKLYSKLDRAVGHYRRYDINFFKKNIFKNARIVELKYLDIFGYFLYFLNKFFFKEETFPTKLKIFIWDKIFTPFTIVVDFLFRYKFGKNILCIYKKIK